MSEELTSATLKGASMVISAQGLSRLITFLGNVLLVRSMNNDAKPLGVSSTQLHLLYVTALALTRDGVRRACLRELPANVSLDDKNGWEIGASLSRAYSLVGLSLVTPVVFYHFMKNPPLDIDQKEYMTSLYLVLVGSSLELLSEPMYVVAQNCSMYKLRSKVEAFSSISRALVGLIASVVFGCRVSAFAWGYCATGLAIFSAFFFGLASSSPNGPALPLQVLFGGPPRFKTNDDVGKFTFLTTIQSAWKLALSEGEKIVMITMGTVASDRGAFAMAANLGSLAARLLLQPSEEAAFTLFGKLKHEKAVFNLLGTLTRAASFVALIFICFGTQYTHLLVMMLYGRGWADDTETPYLLSWYCVFVATCAVNGVTEAFVQAVADDKQTKSFNLWLFACSAVFVITSSALLPTMGTSALIAANSLVMVMRIVRNANFAKDFLALSGYERPVSFSPKPRTLMLFACSLFATFASKVSMYRHAQGLSSTELHVGLGGALFLICLLEIKTQDPELIALLRGRQTVDPLHDKQE